LLGVDAVAFSDQGVSRLTAETVRGRHRIPVIYAGVTLTRCVKRAIPA
jgi:hypothetical protein